MLTVERTSRDIFYQRDSLKLDEKKAVVSDFLVCGVKGKHGYPQRVLEAGKAFYDRMLVHVDRLGGLRIAPHQTKLAWLEEPHTKPDGLYARLHYQRFHPFAKYLVWLVKYNPKSLGVWSDVLISAAGEGPALELLKVNSVYLTTAPSLTLSESDYDDE